MTSILAFRVFPSFPKNLGHRPGFGGRVVCNIGGENSAVLHSDSVSVKGESVVKESEKIGSSIAGGNGHVGSIGGGKKRGKEVDFAELEVLWDDGYGSASMKDYLDIAKEMIKPDGGPPRWFSPVECGRPLKGSPLLLFLPGMDGVGLGLIMHHKALGKVFEVQCLHIPVNDRTPFEGLVDFVEQVVREKHASSPNKPIYLVGDSFGGSLALAVAARNPMVDLVLILANPATSLERSQLKPFFPILEALPDELHNTVPYLLSFVMGEPVKMAMVNVDKKLPPSPMLRQLSKNLTDLLPRLSVISDLIPKDALLWKLKLLKSAAAYANSRLHAVKAEVLVLASLKDNMLPSEDEAKRLSGLLKNCKVRTFKENGHTLLLEDGINLLTAIKATGKYRCSRRMDYITDFVPPSFSEFKTGFDEYSGWLNYYTSPVLFSTLEDGKIVQGLSGVPSEGPVIYVGYHMLMGLEISGLAEGFLREKKILVRGLAHPALFGSNSSNSELSYFDYLKVFGAVPVTASNFFKLLSTKSHILLYPGGAREALHHKGEAYKLFWPDRPEFVRMAAKFKAKIVPFGVVGEDDIAELVLDYNDLMRIPVLNERVRQSADESGRVRWHSWLTLQQNFVITGLVMKGRLGMKTSSFLDFFLKFRVVFTISSASRLKLKGGKSY
ncbi:acyltransferase-like protein At1g54570, chloroplastic isoform X2 [Chenopodium quinoa]|uniref:acyltransferase-like protein At1g54570, chloroplastic isoform X2 n=1 Tax=Chenopodium quinoa TaxID=63459 RepID=UPI000B789D7C|nr:acyltransferase-like protein At1g54570, chloroplastic isoform X2 [Chenopodium quinoa]